MCNRPGADLQAVLASVLDPARTIIALRAPGIATKVGLLLLTACAACSTPTVPEPDAVGAAERRVVRSVNRGVDAANAIAEFVGTLRHNPGPCECPPWEIAIGDRWERVGAEPSRDASAEVTEWLDRPSGTLETAVEISRDDVRSELGWGYRMVIVGGTPEILPKTE